MNACDGFGFGFRPAPPASVISWIGWVGMEEGNETPVNFVIIIKGIDNN